jgi:hypothetical protein
MLLANSVESALTLIREGVNKTLLAQVDFVTHKEQLSEKPISLYMPFEAADDPAVEHLSNDGWNKYSAIIFQSHWQQSMYNLFLGVPYSAGVVIHSMITPIKDCVKAESKDINLLYVGDPRNGLDIVFSVFKKLLLENDNINLYVFSNSGALGNLKDRKNRVHHQFHKEMREHPNVSYCSSESDYSQKSVFEKCHIYLAPNLLPNASHVPLLECMSAEMLCIHSSYGPLPEISLGLTSMYGYVEDKESHANKLYIELHNVLRLYNISGPRRTIEFKLEKDKKIVDEAYGQQKKRQQWNEFLLNLLTNR